MASISCAVFGSRQTSGDPLAAAQIPTRLRTALDVVEAPYLHNRFWRRFNLRRFVEGLGARPTVMDAAEHDTVMAFVSHLPQLTASALMDTVGGASRAPTPRARRWSSSVRS